MAVDSSATASSAPRGLRLKRMSGPPNRWDQDPLRLALEGSEAFPLTGPADPYCVEVGRRILLAQLQFSSWVLRRVERVSFEEGRSVLRTMTIQFQIRPDAPRFVARGTDENGRDKEYWLVPLTVMNRRSLVEFRMRDEEDRPLTMPGVRLGQRLDESVLLAAAAAAGERIDDDVRTFVKDVVATSRPTVVRAMDEFTSGTRGAVLSRLRSNSLFTMALARLRYNFTLYVFLPVSAGRDRLLTMSFVEPIVWRYQRPELERDPEVEGAYTYTPMQPWRISPGHVASVLGWKPTRIRFQTPSAEHAASYHFEVAAPKGVRITEATLIAGRPHEPGKRLTVDHVRADSLTVGLHGVEVPPNSLCRVQVHLRVQRAGWLTTLLVSAAAVFLVLASVTFHAERQAAADADQDTNVIVLLITMAAAVATFVAQRDFPGVAARLVTGLRGFGVAVMGLPLAMAAFLSYQEAEPPVPALLEVPEAAEDTTVFFSWLFTITAAVILALVAVAYVRTWLDERRPTETSPWDMTIHAQRRPPLLRRSTDKRRRRRVQHSEMPDDFWTALERFEFRAPAVGVRSSEGWHHTYCWRPDHQTAAVRALDELAEQRPPHYECREASRCPRAEGNGCVAARRSATVDANGRS